MSTRRSPALVVTNVVTHAKNIIISAQTVVRKMSIHARGQEAPTNADLIMGGLMLRRSAKAQHCVNGKPSVRSLLPVMGLLGCIPTASLICHFLGEHSKKLNGCP